MHPQSVSMDHVDDEELPDRFVNPDNYKMEATNEALNPPPPVINDNNISAY